MKTYTCTPLAAFVATAVVVCGSLLVFPAAAQTAPARVAPSDVAQVNAAREGLYVALGEKPGITRLTDDFVNHLVKDPRVSDQFKDTKLSVFKESLVAQICQLSGGPCEYEGDTMKAAHSELKINKGHFNAMVEVLQAAMDAQGIPFVQQNRLLALLAPMHRDVITVR
ncbi:MAG: group 1 truncated hemoglobin [Burkholderiaceae bacterium]|nr:group 1 truncated hemoglobin [Burkholderiaceae bacterium]